MFDPLIFWAIGVAALSGLVVLNVKRDKG